MNDDDTPGQNAGSGRLWTQPREEDEHTQWLAPRTDIQPPPEFPFAAPEPAEPAPQRRLAPLMVLGALLACLLFGAGTCSKPSSAQNRTQSATSASRTSMATCWIIRRARGARYV